MTDADGVDFLRLLARAFDPVEQAERALRTEQRERERTDPWRWYCRACDNGGGLPEREARDEAACQHLRETDCGHGRYQGRAEAGRLLHVWTYGGWRL